MFICTPWRPHCFIRFFAALSKRQFYRFALSQRRSGHELFTLHPQSPIFAVSPRRPRRAVAAPIVVVVGLTSGRTLISPLWPLLLPSPPSLPLPPLRAVQAHSPTGARHRCRLQICVCFCLCHRISLSLSFCLWISASSATGARQTSVQTASASARAERLQFGTSCVLPSPQPHTFSCNASWSQPTVAK